MTNYMIAWTGNSKDKHSLSGNFFLFDDRKVTASVVHEWVDYIKEYYDLESKPMILNIIRLEDEDENDQSL